MTDAAHTPGPWEATDLTGTPVNDPAVMSAKHCVATVWINDISRKQAGANARLMAAAPELLAALSAIAQRANESGTGKLHLLETIHAMHEIARGAIAKAEGVAP